MFRGLKQLVLIGFSALLLSGCTLPWQKNTAGITVQLTDGGNAQVFLDDLHLGQTPLENSTLKAGVYTVKIVPDNDSKQPYETEIHLYPGSITSILWSFSGSDPAGTGDILELEPLPSKDRAELSVITVPEGAQVSLNTTTYGLSPVILDSIDPGQYSLSVSAVGHTKKALGVKVENGFRLRVYSRLDKEGSQPEPTPLPTPSLAEPEPTPTPLPTPTLGSSKATPTPRPTPKPSPTPVASGSATVPSSGTPAKPYVTIKDTGTGWLRVRDQASSAGVEVAKVTVGASYPYVSSLNGWYEITYLPGKNGWISGQYGDLVR